MHRAILTALGMALTLATLPAPAKAQWGYGYYPYGYGGYGWGGWGARTAQGDIARGLGYFNMGAGIYNRETAIARSINTDTAIRWNQYVYLSQQQGTREYYARKNAAIARDKEAYAALMKRIQENPTPSDIMSGDALNAALDQLSDPRIHSSVLRMAETEIPAQLIRDIRFRNAAEAVTFSLSQLRASTQWPAVLLEPRFEDERKDFEALVEEARKDSLDDGQVTPETLAKLREFTARLRTELAAKPLDDRAENQEALKFVKTVTALTRMLEKPEIEQVLVELKKIEKTTIGHLLGFMHTFNLRFAESTNAREREAYRELYQVLDKTRTAILGEAKLDSTTARENKANLHDFFSAMDLDHIGGKTKNVPTPPAPAQP
jgi:hypothetical protein